MQKQHQTWLIASNPSTYNIQSAFANLDSITWGLTVSTNVGDVIYVYVAAPYSKIMYRCLVERVNVPEDERLGTEYWLSQFDPTRKLVNLRLLSRLTDDRLRFRSLLDAGLIPSAPQGPQRASTQLISFLDDF